MTRTIRTLAQAAQYGMVLRVECIQCDCSATFLAGDVVNYVRRPHRTLDETPFVCSVCGSRKMRVYPFETEGARDRTQIKEIVVWKPTRIRI